MIPIIKRADDSIKHIFGAKYLVGRDNSWDMCYDFGTAVRFWLWHCGIPARIVFKSSKCKK